MIRSILLICFCFGSILSFSQQSTCDVACDPIWNIATHYTQDLSYLTHDLDGDGDEEIINRAFSSGNSYVIFTVDITEDFLYEEIKTSDAYLMRSRPAIFDFDKDGEDDLVVTNGAEVLLLDLETLVVKKCFDDLVDEITGTNWFFFDINNDGQAEIIAGSGNLLVVYDTEFNLLHQSNNQSYTLNLGNFDDDEFKEVIFVNGEVYQYKDDQLEKEYDIPDVDLSNGVHERVVVDINQDGKDEFFYLSETETLRCYDVAAESALFEIVLDYPDVFGFEDLDHDGDIELVVYHQTNNTIKAYDGFSGQLEFTRFIPDFIYSSTHYAYQMNLGNFDGDDGIEFWHGSGGNDHFMYDFDQQQIEHSIPNSGVAIEPNAHAFADLNGDDNIELITVAKDFKPFRAIVSIYDPIEKRLVQTFTSPEHFSDCNTINVFDYGNDGDQDILLTGWYNEPFEDASTQFVILDGETGALELDLLLPFQGVESMVVADVNEDGVVDYLCSSWQNFYILDGTNFQKILESEDFNTFQFTPQYHSAKVTNLDNDPAPEIVLIDELVVTLDDYQTGFSQINSVNPCCSSYDDVVVDDWNGDGLDDIIYQIGIYVTVYSPFTFTVIDELQFWGVGPFNNMLFEDADGDDKKELIFSGESEVVIHHVNERTDIIKTYGYSQNDDAVIRVLDFDLDGELDVIKLWEEGVQEIDINCIECQWIHQNSFTVNPTCYQDNGMIILQSNDPTAKFRFNDQIVGDTIKDLGPGNYEIILSNQWGCNIELNFSLEYENDFGFWEIDRGFQNPTCNAEDGMVWANTNLDGISYSINGVVFQDTLKELAEGDYTLVAFNNYGCFKEYEIELRQPISFDIQLQADICGDMHYFAQLLNVESDQSYQIYWDGQLDNQVSEPLGPGIHTVEIVTDSCTRSKDFEVPEFVLEDLLDLDIEILQNDCDQYYAQIINLVYEADIIDDFSNDTTFVWDNISVGFQSPIFSESGIHVLSTYIGFCLYTWEFEIPEQPSPAYDLVINSTDCGSENFALVSNLQNPDSYQIFWDGVLTNDILSPMLSNGSHILELVSEEGCRYVEQFSVMITSLNVGLQIDHIDCNNSGSAQLSLLINSINEPYETEWSNGLTNVDSISNLSAGDYSVTITDGAGCEEIITINIPEVELTLSYMSQNNLCFGESNGQIELEVSTTANDYFLLWENGSQELIRENLTNGTYTAIIQEQYGCSDTLEVEISSPEALNVSAVISDDNSNTPEPDGSIIVEIFGGIEDYQVLWSNGASGLENLNLSADEYLLFIEDANGCKLDTSFVVDAMVANHNLIDFEVQFYPNPTNGEFNIIFPENQKLRTYWIYDIAGKRLSPNGKPDFRDGGFKIDLRSLKAGLYIVHLEFETGFLTYKLVKQ